MCAVAIGLSSNVRGRAVNHSRLRTVITTSRKVSGVWTALASAKAVGWTMEIR